jgi:hypothetical protein
MLDQRDSLYPLCSGVVERTRIYRHSHPSVYHAQSPEYLPAMIAPMFTIYRRPMFTTENTR